MRSLLHLTQNLLEAGGHVVGLLHAAVVPFEVLQEAEEQRVHRHGVHTKEGTGNEVATDCNEHDRREEVVQGWDLNLHKLARKRDVGGGSGDKDNHELPEEQEEVHHAVQDHHPHQVPHDQVESIQGRFTKIGALKQNDLKKHED